MGWIPANKPQNPFKPGMITNGQPPAEFDATIIQPAVSKLEAKPLKKLQYTIQIKILEKDSINSKEPPTFVFFKAKKGQVTISTIGLDPSKKTGDHEFEYTGTIVCPKDRGTYNVYLEIKYSSYDTSDKSKLTRLKPYLKEIKVGTINVR